MKKIAAFIFILFVLFSFNSKAQNINRYGIGIGCGVDYVLLPVHETGHSTIDGNAEKVVYGGDRSNVGVNIILGAFDFDINVGKMDCSLNGEYYDYSDFEGVNYCGKINVGYNIIRKEKITICVGGGVGFNTSKFKGGHDCITINNWLPNVYSRATYWFNKNIGVFAKTSLSQTNIGITISFKQNN